tara:strand:+ start:1734 stop:1892 length:159 start_codon:yes stop_codon:yes gene_type:complete
MSKVYEFYKRQIEEYDDCEPISICCEAKPSGELDDDIGYCSECGRGSGFISG